MYRNVREVFNVHAAFQDSPFFQIQVGLWLEKQRPRQPGAFGNHHRAALYGSRVNGLLDGRSLEFCAVIEGAIVRNEELASFGGLWNAPEPFFHDAAVRPAIL